MLCGNHIYIVRSETTDSHLRLEELIAMDWIYPLAVLASAVAVILIFQLVVGRRRVKISV